MFLKLSEVKQYYKLSHTTLFELEKEGKLHPNRTTGGHRRYDKAELDALMPQKDRIGYQIKIHFDNYQKLPKIIEMIGYTKPENFEACCYAGEQPPPDHDWDKLPVLDLAKYRRIDHDEYENGWSINGHPQIRTQLQQLPQKIVVLEGNQNTGIRKVTRKYCSHLEIDGKLRLELPEIMDYLDISSRNKWFDKPYSDELPCFFTAEEVGKTRDGTMCIKPILYELMEAR